MEAVPIHQSMGLPNRFIWALLCSSSQYGRDFPIRGQLAGVAAKVWSPIVLWAVAIWYCSIMTSASVCVGHSQSHLAVYSCTLSLHYTLSTCISKYLSQNVSWLLPCLSLLLKLLGCLSRWNCSLISLSSSTRLSFFEGCGFGMVSSSTIQTAWIPSLVRSVATSYCWKPHSGRRLPVD